MSIQLLKEQLPNLHMATVSKKEIKTDIQTISDFVNSRDKTVNIPTKSLNIDGVVVAEAMEKYLDSPSINSGKIKEALKTPYHYFFSGTEDKKKLDKLKDGSHFELGTFLHECLLEPTKFDRVICEPNFKMSVNADIEKGIEYWKDTLKNQGIGYTDNLQELPANKIIDYCKLKVIDSKLDPKKRDGLKAFYNDLKKSSGLRTISEKDFIIVAKIRKHYENYADGIIKKILTNSKREISVYGNINGVDLRVRPDAIQFEENIGKNAVISVKSTAKSDLRGFYSDCAKFSYDLAEAMYQDLLTDVTNRKFDTTITIMLQTVEPFGVALLIWSKDDIDVGRYKFQTGLQTIIEATDNDYYPCYEVYAESGNNGFIEMNLPQWNNSEKLPSSIK